MTNFGYERHKAEIIQPSKPSRGPLPIAGSWWSDAGLTCDSESTAPNSGVTRFIPLFIPCSVEATAIGGLCSSGANAASIWRIGIYSASTTTGLPDTLLASVNLTYATVAFYSAAISYTFQTGNYWWGWRANDQSRASATKSAANSLYAGMFTPWLMPAGVDPSTGRTAYQTSTDGNGNGLLVANPSVSVTGISQYPVFFIK